MRGEYFDGTGVVRKGYGVVDIRQRLGVQMELGLDGCGLWVHAEN
jgi:hypothetical protein